MTAGQVKTSWEEAVEDVVTRTENEVRHVIAYLNDEVVPEVRRDSSRALRAAAGQLTKLADRMDYRRTAERAGKATHVGGASTEPGWATASR